MVDRHTHIESIDKLLQDISTNLVKIGALSNELDNLNKNITITGNSAAKSEVLNKKEKDALKLVESTHTLFSSMACHQLWEQITKIHAEKLKLDFQRALQRFQRIQAEIKRRLILEARNQGPATADLLGIDDGHRGVEMDDKLLFQTGSHQQQMQVNKDGDVHQLGYILQQEEQMQSLEEDIANVNIIFEQLQSLVYDQRTAVDSIEAHIESAYTSQQNGTTVLAKAATSRVRARKRWCICSVVLITIVVIIVLILVAVYYPKK